MFYIRTVIKNNTCIQQPIIIHHQQYTQLPQGSSTREQLLALSYCSSSIAHSTSNKGGLGPTEALTSHMHNMQLRALVHSQVHPQIDTCQPTPYPTKCSCTRHHSFPQVTLMHRALNCLSKQHTHFSPHTFPPRVGYSLRILTTWK